MTERPIVIPLAGGPVRAADQLAFYQGQPALAIDASLTTLFADTTLHTADKA